MNYSDETLMAFTDGELDAHVTAQIEAAARADAGLAGRIASHRRLRRRIEESFTAELEQPVPARLLAVLARPRLNAAPQWAALAASIVVGFGAGYVGWTTWHRPLVELQDGVLVAKFGLSQTLTHSISSDIKAGAEIHVGLTYESKSGDICRSFFTGTLAGIACRRDDRWQMQLLQQRNAADTHADGAGEYRTAGSAMPAAILQAIDADIVGEPMDKRAEYRARARAWHIK